MRSHKPAVATQYTIACTRPMRVVSRDMRKTETATTKPATSSNALTTRCSTGPNPSVPEHTLHTSRRIRTQPIPPTVPTTKLTIALAMSNRVLVAARHSGAGLVLCAALSTTDATLSDRHPSAVNPGLSRLIRLDV